MTRKGKWPNAGSVAKGFGDNDVSAFSICDLKD